jgi:hypothetical protein
MIKPVFRTLDEGHESVQIPIRTSQISAVRAVLKLNSIPQVIPGGHGWQFGEGAVEISGSPEAVRRVTKAIQFALEGPGFETADQVAARHKQGAKP